MKIGDVGGTIEQLGQTDFDNGDGYEDYACDICKMEYIPWKDAHPMVERWVCRQCGMDYCFTCYPKIT